MLLNHFFFLSALNNENGLINATLEMNAGHKIFDGHFPGQPVVPGVCMLQMTREVLEEVLGYKVQLRSADSLKFLAFINPKEINRINIEIQYKYAEEGSISVNSKLYNPETAFFKFKGVFFKKSV